MAPNSVAISLYGSRLGVYNQGQSGVAREDIGDGMVEGVRRNEGIIRFLKMTRQNWQMT